MKLGIVIQTNSEWGSLRKQCMATWEAHAERKGYEINVVDFTELNDSFAEILLAELISNDFDYVGCNFDDLYFSEFYIPEANSLGMCAAQSKVDYFRTDGRAPGTGNAIFTVDGIEFLEIKTTTYKFSTVLGFFSKGLLKKMISQGVRSAWDIERHMDSCVCVAPATRTVSYDNILVKGDLDLLAVYFSRLHIGLIASLKRLGYRKITSVYRKLRVYI
ncbi:hypothetical protein N9A71_05250 [Porticoccaceae bacterium]|nr:hypothetical protein [Porticoccaceae bacterium]